jgi:hypothetical protein
MTLDLEALRAPFPGNAIHWRAQTMNREGTSAMALAYIDARDVQERLDEVCGPANWQDSYAETPKGRLICTLQIRIDGEWISKSDGAGDTDVEGDKGAISDSLKRAAVKWGVGRYLYDFEPIWAECESYEAGGKKKWRKWTDAGLRKLTGASPAPQARPAPRADPPLETTSRMIEGINSAGDLRSLYEWRALNSAAVNASPDKRRIASTFTQREEALKQKELA